MTVRKVVSAADSRLRVAPLLRKAFEKVFPDHWTFMFGEIALYSFLVLVLTGVFVALFFDPSTAQTVYRGGFDPMNGKLTSAAYASAISLSHDVRAGLLIRQTHHWAALVFIGAIVLHLCRVFFTGAFRKPRVVNWLIGVTMLMLALLNGFTGYSMPDDLLSGTGLRIAYSVTQSVPVVGAWLAFLLFGGEFPADATVPRMFVAHVFAVPALLAVLVTAHMLILIRQKHTQFPAPGRRERNVVGSRLWPAYTVRTFALFMAVLAVLFGLGGLFQINPVWLYGPFNPASATVPAQPDWYVAWEEGALRLFPSAGFRIFGYLVPSPFFPGVVLGALTFLWLYLWPLLERWCTGDRAEHQLLDRPRDHPVRLGIGVGLLFFYGLLVVAAADDVIARTLLVPIASVVYAFRVLILTLPWIAGLLAWFLAKAARNTEGGFGEITRADLKAAARRSRPQGGAAEPVPAHLECWAEPGRRWRWRYVEHHVEHPEAGEALVLVSTKHYPSRQAAAEAARLAYPGTPVRTVGRPRAHAAPEPSREPRRRRSRAFTALTAAAVWLLGRKPRPKD